MPTKLKRPNQNSSAAHFWVTTQKLRKAGQDKL